MFPRLADARELHAKVLFQEDREHDSVHEVQPVSQKQGSFSSSSLN